MVIIRGLTIPVHGKYVDVTKSIIFILKGKKCPQMPKFKVNRALSDIRSAPNTSSQNVYNMYTVQI